MGRWRELIDLGNDLSLSPEGVAVLKWATSYQLRHRQLRHDRKVRPVIPDGPTLGERKVRPVITDA